MSEWPGGGEREGWGDGGIEAPSTNGQKLGEGKTLAGVEMAQ